MHLRLSQPVSQWHVLDPVPADVFFSQCSPEHEVLSQPLNDVDKATDEIETRISGICAEVDGIEKVRECGQGIEGGREVTYKV